MIIRLVRYSCAGQASAKKPVKREADANPALSRSGDGNEKSQEPIQRTVLIEMGSGDGVGSPESEDRPVTTTMAALVADRRCA